MPRKTVIAVVPTVATDAQKQAIRDIISQQGELESLASIGMSTSGEEVLRQLIRLNANLCTLFEG